MNGTKKQNYSLDQLSDCIKILSADAVEKAKSGHPGLPLGFSQVMTCLAFEFLKFNPHDSKWFNRDRLVLSAGHGSMMLYSFLYLTGYKDFPLNDIKIIKNLYSLGLTQVEIAKKYNISPSAISLLINNKTYSKWL